MGNEEIKKISKEVVKEIRKEEHESREKSVYQNARLLMKHYNDLKDHYEKGISDIKEMKASINTLDIDEEELYIYSIKSSKVRTLIMISHLEFGLKALKAKQKKNNTYEQYRALELYYIHNLTYEEIGEKLNCSDISARRWVKYMTKELGVFLFGIDALKIKV
ncbi:MAG: hypothetical protein ACRCXT_23020 [Paraclostridium sp.]